MCKAKSKILAVGVTPGKWPTCTACTLIKALSSVVCIRNWIRDSASLGNRKNLSLLAWNVLCGWDCNGDGFVVLGKLAGLLWASHTCSYMWLADEGFCMKWTQDVCK